MVSKTRHYPLGRRRRQLGRLGIIRHRREPSQLFFEPSTLALVAHAVRRLDVGVHVVATASDGHDVVDVDLVAFNEVHTADAAAVSVSASNLSRVDGFDLTTSDACAATAFLLGMLRWIFSGLDRGEDQTGLGLLAPPPLSSSDAIGIVLRPRLSHFGVPSLVVPRPGIVARFAVGRS